MKDNRKALLLSEDEDLIWSIGDQDSLVDTFMHPKTFEPFVVRQKRVSGYPSFHPSSADPDGGYQEYSFQIEFQLNEVSGLLLYIKYIASTPRIPDLQITVNGHRGSYFPYPIPSDDPVIRPSHALHAAIYNKEEIQISIPEDFVVQGSNVLSIQTIDGEAFLPVNNLQAVLRLDRMADACGFHYGAMALYKQSSPVRPVAPSIRPEVFYRENEKGQLEEACSLVVNDLHQYQKSHLRGEIELTCGEKQLSIPYVFSIAEFGQQTVLVWIPEQEGEVAYVIQGDLQGKGVFSPRKKWNIHITPHAHTDIGYTHRQWEVAERMCRNLDKAIELLESSEEGSFSYVIDGTWHLEEYCKTRSPEQIERLIYWIKKGKLGIPWNYADLLTQFTSLEGLIHNGDFSDQFLATQGLIPDRADIVDVASASSSYPTVLRGSGVKYLIHANNQDRGPFRFNGQLHKKSPFWWEGLDGSRVLTWLAKMYCELKKVCGSPASIPAAQRGLAMWLLEYEREDYQPNHVLLYGMEADNTDIDPRAADFIQNWNKTYVYPRLIASNGSSFFEASMPWKESFYSYKGDGGAYWEDGAGSSVMESIQVRAAESGLRNAEVLATIGTMQDSRFQFPHEDFSAAWKQILLYGEHT